MAALRRRPGSKKLTDRMLRRGVFTSVPELETAIFEWATQWNSEPKPFVWKSHRRRHHRKGPARPRSADRKINSPTDHPTRSLRTPTCDHCCFHGLTPPTAVLGIPGPVYAVAGSAAAAGGAHFVMRG